MKHRILAVIVIIICFFSITVSAVDYDYDISLGSDFTVAKYGENLDALSQKMGVTSEQLDNYFKDNSLIYIAISNDAKTQIKISAIEDALTGVNDISQLSDNALNEFANSLNESNNQIVTNNGRKFVCTKTSNQDNGGIYTVTQYSTIFCGKIISFIGYNDGNSTSQEIITAFEGFSLSEKSAEQNAKSITLSIILIIVSIVVFAAIATIMIIGIIKNLRNKNDD